MADKIVLAYSGGLDTSVAIRWLQEQYGVDIATLTMDLGGQVDLEGARQRALDIGAIRADVMDARDEFVREFVWPALR
ncbi:MAG: argininosuccinate synthase, partial [Chloroflexi bacterium]|nr:argininosuccinate synthase [Chloroflexota bacterium]